METVEFPLEGGGILRVRVADTVADAKWGGNEPVTRGGGVQHRLEQAGETFESALEPIRTVAQSVVSRLEGLACPPDDVQVEFGLELTASAGAVLAAAGGSAQLRVALTWHRQATG